tara:strand:- start:382 stop:603 length:222 start_codon:yes stop_codon:yes gene_type:complete
MGEHYSLEIEKRGALFRADDHLKYCVRCNIIWEKVNRSLHGKHYEYYLTTHIPTYGKERKTCPRCVKNKKQGV